MGHLGGLLRVPDEEGKTGTWILFIPSVHCTLDATPPNPCPETSFPLDPTAQWKQRCFLVYWGVCVDFAS